jgi:hypothetical protein
VRKSRIVLSGFCAEAAVLIFVFPYLDFLIARRGIRESSQIANGPEPPDMRVVIATSAILCLGFLVLAVALKDSDQLTEGSDEED